MNTNLQFALVYEDISDSRNTILFTLNEIRTWYLWEVKGAAWLKSYRLWLVLWRSLVLVSAWSSTVLPEFTACLLSRPHTRAGFAFKLGYDRFFFNRSPVVMLIEDEKSGLPAVSFNKPLLVNIRYLYTSDLLERCWPPLLSCLSLWYNVTTL